MYLVLGNGSAKKGVSIEDATWERLAKLAREYGLAEELGSSWHYPPRPSKSKPQPHDPSAGPDRTTQLLQEVPAPRTRLQPRQDAAHRLGGPKPNPHRWLDLMSPAKEKEPRTRKGSLGRRQQSARTAVWRPWTSRPRSRHRQFVGHVPVRLTAWVRRVLLNPRVRWAYRQDCLFARRS